MSAVQKEARESPGKGGNVGAVVDKEGLAPRLPVLEQVKHLSEGLETGAMDQVAVLLGLLLGQLGHCDHDLVTIPIFL